MSSKANIDLRDHVEFLQASELNTESYSFGDLSPGLRAFELTGTPCSDSTLLFLYFHRVSSLSLHQLDSYLNLLLDQLQL